MGTEVLDRCVAVVDILGFRERVRNGSLIEVAEMLRTLVDQVPRTPNYWYGSIIVPGKRTRSFGGRERLYKILFSDTLFLWSDPAPRNPDRFRMRIQGFLQGVAYVIAGALLRGVPLRAGIAYGPTVVDMRKRIVVGQAIVDAYLAEGAQEWVGAGLHDSLPDTVGSYSIKYPVPLKPRTPFTLSRGLDWTMPLRIWDSEVKAENPALARIEAALRHGLVSAGHATVSTKYENTLAFVRHVNEQWDRALARPGGTAEG